MSKFIVLAILVFIFTLAINANPFVRTLRSAQKCLFDDCDCSVESQIFCSTNDSKPFPNRQPSDNATFEVIEFKNYKFDKIPADSFANLSINELHFIDNGLKEIDSYAFNNLTFLKTLVIKEKSLNSIAPDAFSSIESDLLSFEMTSSELTDSKYSMWNQTFIGFKNLYSMDLSNNKLNNIDINLPFTYLKGLTYLNLSYNQLESIKGTFLGSLFLTSLDISNNKLNTSQIFQTIAYSYRLKYLNIDNNLVDNLDISGYNIYSLSARNNRIERFDEKSLKSWKWLEMLDLSNNLISYAVFNSLETSFIANINLSNNQISELPKLSYLKKLISLDLSNQNGKLKSLKDFSFDISQSVADLTVNLDGNHIPMIENKTFCRIVHDESIIEKISLSYETVKSTNKCILKQLSRSKLRTELEVGKRNDESTDYSEVCNCETILYFDDLRIDLTGVCSGFDKNSCPNIRLADNCNRDEFICHKKTNASVANKMSLFLLTLSLFVSLKRFLN